MPDTYRFLIMTTDPVHIGTGGMRLGRVDNTIVREPGTNLPKIPGTALHGVIRAYAARRYGKIQCAGQGSKEGRKHCGRPTCPICYTFGSIQGEAGSFSGVVSITDARILLFPVYSMVGPVWVTSPSALEDFGIPEQDVRVQEGKAKWPKELTAQGHLNLGWLMVEKEGEWTPKGKLKEKLKEGEDLPDPVKERVVLISDKLFTHVVNSNLEVRTSVSINPETGAAEEGALYSYEAIPRSTILWFDVIVDDFRNSFPSKENLEKWGKILESDNESKTKELLKNWKLWNEKADEEKFNEAIEKAKKWISEEKEDDKWKWENMEPQDKQTILFVIVSGLKWTEHLGIGGMGTRGFGRVKKLVCLKLNQDGNFYRKCDEDE